MISATISTSTTIASAPVTAPGQVCTFWVDGLYFGVAVEQVQEVLRYQEMTVVPRAHRAVRGLINLRGQIITAIDLRHRLGLPERPAGALPMNVIVRSHEEIVSLLVDDIGDVTNTGAAALDAVPPNLSSALRDVLRGVLPLPGAILLVLDPDRAGDVAVESHPTGGTQ